MSRTDLSQPLGCSESAGLGTERRDPSGVTAWGARWRSHPGWWGRPGVSCQGGLAPDLLPGCLTLPSSPPHGAGGPRRPVWTQAASSPACCGHCAQQASGSQTPPASLSLRPLSPGFLTSRSCDPGTQPSGHREKVSHVPGPRECVSEGEVAGVSSVAPDRLRGEQGPPPPPASRSEHHGHPSGLATR